MQDRPKTPMHHRGPRIGLDPGMVHVLFTCRQPGLGGIVAPNAPAHQIYSGPIVKGAGSGWAREQGA